MRRTRKLIIWFVSLLVVLFLAAFIGASVFINHYKNKFEQILTDNIGLETKIDGSISLKVTPGLSFIADDVKVISNETYVLRIEKAEIGVDYMKLFKSDLDIRVLRLTGPQVYINCDPNGKFNFESNKPVALSHSEGADLHELNINELSIDGGRILYVDLKTGDTLMVDGINLKSDKVAILGNLSNIEVNKIMFDGTVDLGLFRMNRLKIKDLKFKIDGRGGKMAIIPVEHNYFEGKNTGKAILNFTRTPTQIEIQNQITGLDLSQFEDFVFNRNMLQGKLDLKLDINFNSFNWEQARNSLNGSISLSGENLIMKGISIDRELKNFKEDQQFDVSSLCALFAAGPYGAVLAKGIYPDMNKSGKDSILVKKLVANWQISKGIARSQDVAFSTSKYRLCLTGGLNFDNNSYRNVNISLINRKGCVAISENIEGPFSAPETKTQSVSGMISVSAENIWKSLSKSYGSSCSPVYKGSVEHPR